MTATGVEITRLDHTPAMVPKDDVATLESTLKGRILFPGDDAFAEATVTWNGMVARRPAMVVQPGAAEDLTATISFARARTCFSA